jgi:hypothetical protein
MLQRLDIKNVSFIEQLTLEFGPRLNILTGDNGLGKSFLLDLAWFALTNKWPHEVNPSIRAGYAPRPRGEGDAEIQASSHSHDNIQAKFLPGNQSWQSFGFEYSWTDCPILYFLPDQGCCVWDPHRNYLTRAQEQDRQPAYVLPSHSLWDGLKIGEATICNGLVRDLALWQLKGNGPFRQFTELLAGLSDEQLPLSLGEPKRLSIRDSTEYPTIKMPDGDSVPIPLASSAIKRILSLVYAVIWAWQEYMLAAEFRRVQPTKRMVVLIDEVEAHLHPRWQRLIVPALLKSLTQVLGLPNIQFLIATHSPLVLASLEPHFDPQTDRWWDLDLADGRIQATNREFQILGDANKWLKSDAFDLPEATSLERQQALHSLSQAV